MYKKEQLLAMIDQRKKEIMQKHEEQKKNVSESIKAASEPVPTGNIVLPNDPEVQAEIDEYEKNGPCKSCQGL